MRFFKQFVNFWILREFLKMFSSELVSLFCYILCFWMHIETQRLSGAMVNALDHLARVQYLSMSPIYLIILFIMMKSVQLQKCFAFYYFSTIFKVTIDDWLVWAVGVYSSPTVIIARRPHWPAVVITKSRHRHQLSSSSHHHP